MKTSTSRSPARRWRPPSRAWSAGKSPAADCTVNSYPLTVDGVGEQVDYGKSVSKTAAKKEGHTFTGWTVDGVTVDDPTAATISFTMPANAVTLATGHWPTGYEETRIISNL